MPKTTRYLKNHPTEHIIGDINKRDNHMKSWLMAMQEKLQQFERCQVWELVHPPKGVTIIGTKRIYKKKLDEHRTNTRNKARFINEEVNVKQPPIFEHEKHPHHVYKLKKAFYGLKQAPRAWYKWLSKYPLSNEFVRSKIDSTLITKIKILSLCKYM